MTNTISVKKTLATTFFVYFVITFLWAVYRSFETSELLDELIFKPIIWLIPVLVAVFVIEKNNFESLGFLKFNLKTDLAIGMGLGIFSVLVRILSVYIKYGNLEIEKEFGSITFFLITSFFTAISEEIVFRGYLLNRWLKLIKPQFFSLFLNFVAFAAGHIFRGIFDLHYTGVLLFNYVLAIGLFCLIDIYIFVITKKIYAPIISHIIWNFFSAIIR